MLTGPFARGVLHTALVNVLATVAAGLTGLVIARSLGPTVRGEYAAVMVWFGTTILMGEIGLTAATTYFVARHPARAADYVATARRIMMITGGVALAIGFAVTPVLAGTDGEMAWGLRLMFVAGLVSFAGAGYIFGLQARSLPRWNLARAAQPVLFALAILALTLGDRLNLRTVLGALAATIALQALLSYRLCSSLNLTRGRGGRELAGPMARYGVAQLSATVPALLILRVDQLVLSLVAAPATLGRYTVAASLTTLAVPVVTALGYVAFPRMASQSVPHPGREQMQRWSLLASAIVGLACVGALAVSAPWLVPAVFGPSFDESVPLIWLLAPAGVFLGCGQVCGDLLRGQGRPAAVARAQWAAAAVVVVLLVSTTPVLGVAAAAAASTSTATGIALALMVVSLRRASRETPRSGVGPAAALSTREA